MERARNEHGHYIADDPGTKNVNEAYKPIYQTLLMVVYSAYFVGRSIEKHQSIKQ